MEDRRSLPPYEDELSLLLLRSAERDEPSASAHSKAATALGLSAAVGLSASAPAVPASSGLSASGAARWSGSFLAKGVVLGVSSALLVAGSVALVRQRLRPSQANAAPSAAALTNAARLSAPSPSATFPTALTSPALNVPVPAPALSPSLNVPAPAPALNVPVPVPSRSPARTPKKSSLPEQVLSLDRARVALGSGDAAAALAEIAHYRSAWPRGVFLTEASVLEIEALARRGEVALAGMRAQAFVTLHPDSPQAERLRALIPGASR